MFSRGNIMTTKTIFIHDKEISLHQLIEQARAGIDIVLADDQGPAVRLVPIIHHPQKRVPDLHKGSIKMSEDFHEPLADEF